MDLQQLASRGLVDTVSPSNTRSIPSPLFIHILWRLTVPTSYSTVSPEVCSCKHYGLKADVYSFAIVFWEVFSGQEAYYRMSFDKHFDHVVIKGKRPNPKVAASNTRNLSKSLLHLMPEMWSAKPQERPTFRSICDRLAGECVLSSNQKSRNLNGDNTRDSDRSHQSFVTDRTRYLMNRSLRSRYASDAGESNDSSGSPHMAT